MSFSCLSVRLSAIQRDLHVAVRNRYKGKGKVIPLQARCGPEGG